MITVDPGGDPYRIDFALTVLAGNLTRYQTIRPLVDSDHAVRPRWYPVRTWVPNDWLSIFPGHVRLRLRHFLDSRKLFLRPPADAVVIHAMETYSLYCLWRSIFRLPTVVVSNPDGYFFSRGRVSRWLLDHAVRNTSLVVPWSTFVANEMIRTHPEVAPRLHVLHPGIDLKAWPLRRPPTRGARFQLLFVGGDAVRKGVETLLDAYDRELRKTCDLVVVTQPAYNPEHVLTRLEQTPGVTVRFGLEPGNPELKHLFHNCDAFILPTNDDMSPWVVLEALATGVPVIASAVGGIPDFVRDGETGLLVSPRSVPELIAAVRRLEASPELADAIVRRGREHVEQNYDASVNTPRFIELIETEIDKNRSVLLAAGRTKALRFRLMDRARVASNR